MNRQQAKKLLPIIQAFAEGKTIQYRHGDVDWVDVAPYGTLSFSDDISKYRIKSKQKYRPFKDAEECWNEMLKHQPFGWLKDDVIQLYNIINITTSDKDDVEHLKESNKFKYELIQHQQKLIKYQDVMISSLGDVLCNEYGYDLPQFDGEEQDNIDIEKEIIDSLYKSQQ